MSENSIDSACTADIPDFCGPLLSRLPVIVITSGPYDCRLRQKLLLEALHGHATVIVDPLPCKGSVEQQNPAIAQLVDLLSLADREPVPAWTLSAPKNQPWYRRHAAPKKGRHW